MTFISVFDHLKGMHTFYMHNEFCFSVTLEKYKHSPDKSRNFRFRLKITIQPLKTTTFEPIAMSFLKSQINRNNFWIYSDEIKFSFNKTRNCSTPFFLSIVQMMKVPYRSRYLQDTLLIRLNYPDSFGC